MAGPVRRSSLYHVTQVNDGATGDMLYTIKQHGFMSGKYQIKKEDQKKYVPLRNVRICAYV